MWPLMKNEEEEEGQEEEEEREEERVRGKGRRDILRKKKKQTGLLDSYRNISNNYCISLFLILPSTNNSWVLEELNVNFISSKTLIS